MIGNNLSTLGVSAAQLTELFQDQCYCACLDADVRVNSARVSATLKIIKNVATRLAGHFSYSKEDAQEQPNTEAFENTQLRLSDGSLIFTPNLFGPGI